MRLDRFLIRLGLHSCKEVAQLLADHQVTVDGHVQPDGRYEINRFTRIELAGETLQNHEAIYLMLHKPAGYLSATSDPTLPTVIDLIDLPDCGELHIAGRLDRASTGLLLLTNNGRWSKRVTEPDQQISKTYRVITRDPITPETAARFATGIYFAFEDLTTRPAQLETLSPTEALLSIHEGRYHQVKRMFHAVENQVLRLHRESIGPLTLDTDLAPGKFRHLSAEEIQYFQLP